MYLLLDIGGTKMRIGRANQDAHIEDVEIFPTPGKIEEATQITAEYIKKHQLQEIVKGAGIGFAGTLDKSSQTIVNSPHLRSWEDKQIGKIFQVVTKAPVYVENDTSVVGLGEVHYGSGDKGKVSVYITISTGVGGTRIVNGEIDENTFGFEPGHHIVNFTKTPVEIDGYQVKAEHGTLEEYISGSAIKRFTKKDPEETTDESFWRRIADITATGLVNISLFWSPDEIILGGALISQNAIPFEYLKDQYEENLDIFAKDPVLKKAELDDIGGLHGAFILISQKL